MTLCRDPTSRSSEPLPDCALSGRASRPARLGIGARGTRQIHFRWDRRTASRAGEEREQPAGGDVEDRGEASQGGRLELAAVAATGRGSAKCDGRAWSRACPVKIAGTFNPLALSARSQDAAVTLGGEGVSGLCSPAGSLAAPPVPGSPAGPRRNFGHRLWAARGKLPVWDGRSCYWPRWSMPRWSSRASGGADA